MATSSLLGGSELPDPVAGKDTDALGPSDNSDSGSDAQGAYGDDEMASDSDAVGTGERATVGNGLDLDQDSADIRPDHIERIDARGGDDLDAIADDEGLDATDVDSLAQDDSDDELDEDGEGSETDNA